MKKFTFKKCVPTGSFRSFDMAQTDIKLNKKVVGSIDETRMLHPPYLVRFAVKKDPTKKSPAYFKWAQIKKRFNNEKDARQFIMANNDKIQSSIDIHCFKD